MAATARLLGTGIAGAGDTLLVTVSGNPTATEMLLVCGLEHTGPDGTWWTQKFTSVTSTGGKVWKRNDGTQAPRPLIGTTQSLYGGGAAKETIEFDTAFLSAGAGVVAGDVITCIWDAAPGLAPSASIGILIALDGMLEHYVNQDGFPLYFNSDQNPENGNAANVLDWNADVSGITHADTAGAYLGLYGSAGGSAVVPTLGAKFTELSAAGLYLAATFSAAVAAGATIDPSATFTGGSACEGNYQIIQLSAVPPPPGPSPKPACTRCGSGLMGLSYRIPP